MTSRALAGAALVCFLHGAHAFLPTTARRLAAASTRRAASASSSIAMDAGVVKTLRVGLVGGGTVGGGIVEMLAEKEVFLRDCMNAELPVTAIAVRDPSVPRSFEVPAGVEVTSDWESVVNDPNVDIVVEVMGGTTLAREVIEKALRAGKSVVTANKALIADQLPELQAILAETTAEAVADGRTPPRFGFEAAVCGGIPVIHVMQHDLAGDSVTRISGIMNGCTNFMLTGMDRDKLSYAEVRHPLAPQLAWCAHSAHATAMCAWSAPPLSTCSLSARATAAPTVAAPTVVRGATALCRRC